MSNLSDPYGYAWMHISRPPARPKKKKNMPFPFLPPGETSAKIAKVVKPPIVSGEPTNIWRMD